MSSILLIWYASTWVLRTIYYWSSINGVGALWRVYNGRSCGWRTTGIYGSGLTRKKFKRTLRESEDDYCWKSKQMKENTQVKKKKLGRTRQRLSTSKVPWENTSSAYNIVFKCSPRLMNFTISNRTLSSLSQVLQLWHENKLMVFQRWLNTWPLPAYYRLKTIMMRTKHCKSSLRGRIHIGE